MYFIDDTLGCDQGAGGACVFDNMTAGIGPGGPDESEAMKWVESKLPHQTKTGNKENFDAATENILITND